MLTILSWFISRTLELFDQPYNSPDIILGLVYLKNKTVDPQKKKTYQKAKRARTAEAWHVSESTAKRCRREAEKESKENNDGETAEVKKFLRLFYATFHACVIQFTETSSKKKTKWYVELYILSKLELNQ